MKLNILIILLSLQLIAFSQKDLRNHAVVIKGTVLSTSNNEPVENAVINLNLPGGITFSHETNVLGNYEFRFQSESSSSCTVSLATDKRTISPSFKLGFLHSKDIGKLNILSDTIYIKNFALSPVSCGPSLPTFIFNTNSILSCNDSLYQTHTFVNGNFDNELCFLVSLLKDASTTVIEIDGHTSSLEQKPEYLALYRAEYIRKILVAKGIHEKRIQVKSFGERKPLISDAVIKKAKSKEEKRALHLRNQRVTFRIISWDFKED